MKVCYNVTSNTCNGHSIKIAGKPLSVETNERAFVIEVDGVKLFLEGEFYYSKDGLQNTCITSENLPSIITSLVRNHGIDCLAKHLEGSYVCCWADLSGSKAGFFGDNLNRVPTYYSKQGDSISISTDLKDLASKRRGLDQFSLYSYLLLGYSAARDTFYSGVKRLASDEFFVISNEGIDLKLERSPIKIEAYSQKDLYRYDDIFTNAVDSRAATNNVVMNSGGWDSTSILYKLTESQPKGAVSAAVFDVVLPDGQSFNSYEVDKATRIGKYYGIQTERAEIDYSDQSLIDYWISHLDVLRNTHTYFWLHHLKIGDMIGTTAKSGTRVFNGEASDSIHNFGFSQFVSVNYDNMQLREIADKGKSYLYGPSFFEGIDNQQNPEDKIYNFFKSYYGKEKFVDTESLTSNERRKSYFEAFMLSYPRIPFAKWQIEVARDSLQHDFASFMNAEYFSDMVEQCRPETLYYWLLQLYRRFHFNSYQIGITQVALQPHQLHCAMPFLDSQLLDYMYRMPEDWGRGLELRTTKYPLRFLAEHKWRMPLDILMEKGPHSYIAEGDRRWSYSGGTWNIYCEIMYKSVLSNYFKSVFQATKVEEIFDSTLFDVDKLRSIVEGYVAGEERPSDVTMLFRLAILFSIGFLP
jgi:asparagine synthetase B (glutamine-hydrolysing)